MSAINAFLRQHGFTPATNPCISPDACLDWTALQAELPGNVRLHPHSRFSTAHGSWMLAENGAGDHAWILEGKAAPLAEGIRLADGRHAYPATYANLLVLKNLVLEHDAGSTLFPRADGTLGRGTLGVGARFTTLHWPAVEWAMAALGLGLTANQNSIPRELVYDVEAMLEGRLDTVPFPFIGTSVPEGHQGQSVEGMGHGCILSKLKTGFHLRRIPWSFNADHQPIGGKFDAREDALVRGCLLASYITFDLSPELAQTRLPERPGEWVRAQVAAEVLSAVRARLDQIGIRVAAEEFDRLLATVWPAVAKMKKRDDLYAAARRTAFTTPEGRAYLRELSIDELPGLTTAETTAVMLALCEALGMRIDFVAPAFGFQKNMPYPDNVALRGLIEKQWAVCRQFGAGIGFHSGSGKSAENYQVMGQVTGGRLEIKTSGRYTYEMGRALAASADPGDHRLWLDWHAFTVDLAVQGAFSLDETERKMARSFITDALVREGKPGDIPDSPEALSALLRSLPPSPDHMFWFEYNFLYVLAADGRAAKEALGDHSPAGYRQRARFYGISDTARLAYARNVAAYLVFLARNTGLARAEVCDRAEQRLREVTSLQDFLSDIAG
jgi:hypothetical protein